MIPPKTTSPPETTSSKVEAAGAPRERGAAGHRPGKCLMTRRHFLLTSGLATATVMVTLNAGTPFAHEVPGMVATYPRKLVAKLSALEGDAPVDFQYPDEGAYSEAMIVKLGVSAGGGGLYLGARCLGGVHPLRLLRFSRSPPRARRAAASASSS